jgi:anti-sigma regulatory factor (Ser/Thr protein kinase)
MSLKTSGAPMSLVLPFTPASAGVARHELGRWLEQLASCDDDDAGDCALVVSELVGNAVRHAQPLANGTVEVSWHKQPDGVDIAVTDGGGSTRPRKVDAGLSDLAGRGLGIVEALAGRWWVESSRARTTVHAFMAGC